MKEQLVALLRSLEAQAARAGEVRSRFEAGLKCACYFDEVNPGFRLDGPPSKVGIPLGIDFHP